VTARHEGEAATRLQARFGEVVHFFGAFQANAVLFAHIILQNRCETAGGICWWFAVYLSSICIRSVPFSIAETLCSVTFWAVSSVVERFVYTKAPLATHCKTIPLIYNAFLGSPKPMNVW
jgi:hypothetical protein